MNKAYDAYELSIKNYGKIWTKEMVAKLVTKGLITAEQYKQIVGEGYIN